MKKIIISVLVVILLISFVIPLASAVSDDAVFDALCIVVEDNRSVFEGHLTEPTAFDMLPERLAATWNRYRFVYTTTKDNVYSFTQDNSLLTDQEFESVIFSPLYPLLIEMTLMENDIKTDIATRFANKFSRVWGIYLVYLNGEPLAIMSGDPVTFEFSLTGVAVAELFDSLVTGRHYSDFLFLGVGPFTDMITRDGDVFSQIAGGIRHVNALRYARAFELTAEQIRKDLESGAETPLGGHPVYDFLFGARARELDVQTNPSSLYKTLPFLAIVAVAAIVTGFLFVIKKRNKKNRR